MKNDVPAYADEDDAQQDVAAKNKHEPQPRFG